MVSPASINFAESRAALDKAATHNPAWFDRANDVYADTKDGKKQLLHAIMDGLLAAYEAGRSGKGLPPLKHVEPHAESAAAAKAAAKVAPVAPSSAPKPGRIARTPSAPAPAAPKRISRGAR